MRECGSCAECCFSLGVHELSKACFLRCAHERKSDKGSCSIYASRPESCSTFRCMWLDGYFGRKDRPDRLGIVLAATAFDNDKRPAAIAYIRKTGAEKTGRGRELLEDLANGGLPVCVLRRDLSQSLMVNEDDRHHIPQLRTDFSAAMTVDSDGKLRKLPVVR